MSRDLIRTVLDDHFAGLLADTDALADRIADALEDGAP